MSNWQRLLGLVCCAALLGCPKAVVTPPDAGQTVDSGSPTSDAGTIADLCQPRWQVLCEAWSKCENSAPYFPTFFADLDACVQKGTANCKRYAALQPPGLTGTPEEAVARFAACTAAAAKQTACGTWADYVAGFNAHIDPECAALPGTLADGANCTFGEQCQSSFCRFQGACGTCARRSEVGETCETNVDCTLGNACVSGACFPFRQPDAGCTQFAPCTPGYSCISSKCQTQLDEGAPCVVNAPNPCRVGYCNAGRCQAYVVDAGPGDFCGVAAATGVVSVCGRGSACDVVTQSYQGVCVNRAQEGDRCFFDTGFQGAQCEVFSQCANGVCATGAQPTCGEDGGVHPARRDGGILPPLTPDAATIAQADRHRQIVCDALFACPRLGGLVANFFSSRAGCDDALRVIETRSLTAPFSSLSGLQACDTALQALPACEIADRTFGTVPALPECDLPGSLPPGAVCESNSQCQAGSRCNAPLFTNSVSCGVCSKLRTVGDNCIDSRDCARGLACGQGRCVSAAAVGATCSSTAPCDRSLTCVAGVCAATPDIGAACSPSASTCGSGLWCNSNTSKCEVIQVADLDAGSADAGTACGSLNGSLVFCPWGSNCRVTNAVANTGVCEAARGLGEACAFSGGLDGRGGCRFPAICRDNVCQLFDATFCQ